MLAEKILKLSKEVKFPSEEIDRLAIILSTSFKDKYELSKTVYDQLKGYNDAGATKLAWLFLKYRNELYVEKDGRLEPKDVFLSATLKKVLAPLKKEGTFVKSDDLIVRDTQELKKKLKKKLKTKKLLIKITDKEPIVTLNGDMYYRVHEAVIFTEKGKFLLVNGQIVPVKVKSEA